MSNKLGSVLQPDGTKKKPAWLREDRDLSETSPKNRKNLQRSYDYYNKVYLTIHPGRTFQDKINFIWKCSKELNEIFGLKNPNDYRTFVVDHMVPVTSEVVSGFQCDWNLQIITVEENTKKSNHTWPGMHRDDMFPVEPDWHPDDVPDDPDAVLAAPVPGAWLDELIRTKWLEPKEPVQLEALDEVCLSEQVSLL